MNFCHAMDGGDVRPDSGGISEMSYNEKRLLKLENAPQTF